LRSRSRREATRGDARIASTASREDRAPIADRANPKKSPALATPPQVLRGLLGRAVRPPAKTAG
jgi:hypothetical protein